MITEKNKLLKTKSRIWELDFFRGLAILLVLVDHTMFDLKYVFTSWATSGSAFLQSLHNYGSLYMASEVRFFWRPAFLFIFFATSGICTAFSKNNFLRGVKLGCVAITVSIITYYVEFFTGESTFILFGVLHCLAVIILIYSAISVLVDLTAKATCKIINKPFNEKLIKYIASFIYLALAVVFFVINNKYNVALKDVHASFATVKTDSKILGILFFVQNWWYADYFPLFPFISFFFFGASLAHILYPNKKSLLPKLDGNWNKVFTIPGRNSLIVYLSGQVIILTVCWLLQIIFTV